MFVNLNPDFRRLYQAILESRLFKVTVLATSRYALHINSIDESLCSHIFIIEDGQDCDFKYADQNLDNIGWVSELDRFECLGVSRSRDSLEKIERITISTIHKIFHECEINFIVNEMVANMGSYLLARIGADYGVPYVSIMGSRLPGRMIIDLTDGIDEAHLYRTLFEGFSKKELIPTDHQKEIIHEYLRGFENVMPDYMRIGGLSNLSFWNLCQRVFINIAQLSKDIKAGFIYPYDPFLGCVYKYNFLNKFRTIKRFFRCKFQTIKYDCVASEKFFLYPLHYHPEASTSVLSWANFNEIDIIRSIASSMPRGFKLYVKDHPSAKGFLSSSDYERIKSIPNVRLINSEINAKYLIKRSVGVVTLTSTVGYESLIIGKPVITMGDIFYNFHPLCINVKNHFELPKAIRRIIDIPPTTEYTLNFLYAYLNPTTSVSYDFNSQSMLNDFPAILKHRLEEIEV